MDLSFILEIASTVPSKVQRGISNLVARLDKNMELVLKVVCIVGGNAPVSLILHLLETVKPFCLFWKNLCRVRAESFHRLSSFGMDNTDDRASAPHAGAGDSPSSKNSADSDGDGIRKMPSFHRQNSAPLASKRTSHEFNFLRRKDAADALRESKLNAYKAKFARRSKTMPHKPASSSSKNSAHAAPLPPTSQAEVDMDADEGVEFTDAMHDRGINLLIDILTSLAEKQFFSFSDSDFDSSVTVSDMFLVDTVCGVMPFQQRQNLHLSIALWHKQETAEDIGERMKRFPIIVHHYVMALQEERGESERQGGRGEERSDELTRTRAPGNTTYNGDSPR